MPSTLRAYQASAFAVTRYRLLPGARSRTVHHLEEIRFNPTHACVVEFAAELSMPDGVISNRSMRETAEKLEIVDFRHERLDLAGHIEKLGRL